MVKAKGAADYYDLNELLDGFKEERLANLIKGTDLDPEVIIFLVRSGWNYDFEEEREHYNYGDLFDAIDDWYSEEESLSKETRDDLSYYFNSRDGSKKKRVLKLSMGSSKRKT